MFGLLGLLVMLGLLGFFLVKTWVRSYMKSPALADRITQKIGAMVQAEPEATPLEWTGQSFYCDEITARGDEGAVFSELAFEAVRAEIDLTRLSDREVGLPVFQAGRGSMRVGDDRRGTAPEPPPKATGLKARFGPKRVEVPEARIDNFTFEFDRGDTRIRIVETAAVIRPHYEVGNLAEGHLDLEGRGGFLYLPSLPPVEIDEIQLRVSRGGVYIKNAILEYGDHDRRDGDDVALIEGHGEIFFGKRGRYETSLLLQDLKMEDLVKDAWKSCVKGVARIELDTEARFGAPEGPSHEGSFDIDKGVIHDLPVLEKLAAHTRDDRFLDLDLSEAKGDFKRTGDRIEVRNLVLEKNGLIRIVGDADIVARHINGVFEVGVTRESLRWIPGAERKVFTTDKGGYVWTTMRVHGPLAAPQEDLSRRLKAGAVEAIVEDTAGAAVETAGAVAETGVGILGEATNSLFGVLPGSQPVGEDEPKNRTGTQPGSAAAGIGSSLIGEGVDTAKDAAGGAAKILGDFVPLLPGG